MPQSKAHFSRFLRSCCSWTWSRVESITRYRRLSSANSRQRVSLWTWDGMSLIYRRNMRGPSTVPWETPDDTASSGDFVPSTKTDWVLPTKNSSIHLSRFPGQAWPNYFFCFYLSKITSNLPEIYLSKSKITSYKKLLKYRVKLLFKSNLSKSKKVKLLHLVMFTNSHVMKNRNRGKKINIKLLKNKIPDHLIIIIMEVVCNINNKTMSIKNNTNRSIWHWYKFQAINLILCMTTTICVLQKFFRHALMWVGK